jgi:hypothetical protein
MSNAHQLPASNFIHANEIRSRFSRAMSAMYREEVPQYGTLVELVADINAGTLDAHPRERFVMVAGHAGVELLRRVLQTIRARGLKPAAPGALPG